jgi:hypothetical protein
MSKQYRINVYENGCLKTVIARVRHNTNLDFWNGHNWSCGEINKHKGLTKLKDGRYVLIYSTDIKDKKDYALIISEYQALQEILKSKNMELLKRKKWKNLKKLYEEY